MKYPHGCRLHAVAAVRKLIPEFVMVGAEVLDPIQTRAAGMNPEGLKKDYGHFITFCGAWTKNCFYAMVHPTR